MSRSSADAALTRLFVQDLKARVEMAEVLGVPKIELPATHLAALLELLCELDLEVELAKRPRLGEVPQ